MRIKRFIAFVCAFAFGLQLSPAQANHVKENALVDLKILEHLLEIKYAPKVWKETLFGWSLQESTDRALSLINGERVPSTKFCQRVLADYIANLNDYHAGITFFSTESAVIPYAVKLSGDGRCFVVESFDSARTLLVGDEILEMDNLPVMQVIESLRKGIGSPADSAAAARFLFARSAALGHVVPAGSSYLKVQKANGVVTNVRVRWRYTPENVGDLASISYRIREPKLGVKGPKATARSSSLSFGAPRQSSLFSTPMQPYFWPEVHSQYQRRERCSDHDLGSLTGFLPHFGRVVWQSQKAFPCPAYAFSYQDKQGRDLTIGVVRIPSYDWSSLAESANVVCDEAPWQEFIDIIRELEERTDALIIDQTANPGGSVLYLYGLLSALTDRPLHTPKHRMILTQTEVNEALDWLERLNGVYTDEAAQDVLGSDMEGLAMNMTIVRYLKDYANNILSYWAKGEINLTPAMPLLGIESILPSPHARYTKPLCVLIDGEDFSCGDLFPAILKDNDRALVLGMPTAGAGGFVFSVEYPNRSGIRSCSLTGSLAVRANGSLIENLGVAPHISIPLTTDDVRSGEYKDYMGRVLDCFMAYIENGCTIGSDV